MARPDHDSQQQAPADEMREVDQMKDQLEDQKGPAEIAEADRQQPAHPAGSRVAGNPPAPRKTPMGP